jgi:hypothetical protein
MSMPALLSSILVVACVSFSGFAQTPQAARPTPDKQILLTRAQRGDVSAMMWLGAGYEQGWSGKGDYQEALKWLRRAAKHGDPDAQNNLGQIYENGEGATKCPLRKRTIALVPSVCVHSIPTRTGRGSLQ